MPESTVKQESILVDFLDVSEIVYLFTHLLIPIQCMAVKCTISARSELNEARYLDTSHIRELELLQR